MLLSQLAAIRETMPLAGLDRLAEHLPLAWIEEALACAGSASVRRRRLPAEQVVWPVIALALYRHQSMAEVLATLDLALPREDRPFVSKSAITQARQRLGEAPLARLFEATARAWSAQDADYHCWKGLQLLAMDGTTFRAADSAENRAHFGAQNYPSGKVASYPQVRGVTPMGNQNQLSRNQAVVAGMRIDPAQPFAGRRRARDLGGTDCLQPRPA